MEGICTGKYQGNNNIMSGVKISVSSTDLDWQLPSRVMFQSRNFCCECLLDRQLCVLGTVLTISLLVIHIIATDADH